MENQTIKNREDYLFQQKIEEDKEMKIELLKSFQKKMWKLWNSEQEYSKRWEKQNTEFIISEIEKIIYSM
jgi:hypothetical protein